MISLRIKSSLYIFFVGLIFGFITAFFVLPLEDSVVNQPSTVTVNKMTKEAASMEKQYQKQINLLENKNDSLKSSLTKNKLLLEQAKLSTRNKEQKIKKIAADTYHPPKYTPTTFKIPLFDDCICDSLKQEVSNYINETKRKDSLYEVQLVTMDSVVWVKDSVIRTSEGLYNSLSSIFNKTIAQQKVLQDENHLLKKKERRRKTKNRLIAAGLSILSGLFIYKHISH